MKISSLISNALFFGSTSVSAIMSGALALMLHSNSIPLVETGSRNLHKQLITFLGQVLSY